VPEVPPLPRTRPLGLADRVEHALSDAGPVAAAFEGFEPRPGQRRLAAEVARVVDSGGTLIAEAGTGTGKTLAYLVPAVLAGRRVLISTGTRTLQDQVFYKDLPALARALDLEIRAAYMKGRTNFLCLHRFERLREAAAGLPPNERRWLERIAEWAAATATGDRSEIEDLPDDSSLWSELTATSEQCLGRECPQYADCFVTRMRERAAEASIVIVNHHLLCADASVRQSEFGEVIPDCDVLVIDEAHQLEDIVTQYFGLSLSTYRIDELAHDGAAAVATVPAEDGRFAVAVARALATSAGRTTVVRRRAAELRRSDGSGDRVTLSPTAAERLNDVGIDLSNALTRSRPHRRACGGATGSRGHRVTRRHDARGAEAAARDERWHVMHFIEARGRGVFLRRRPSTSPTSFAMPSWARDRPPC
jgi:ATP-dependent DNA helicase DinG